MENKKEYNDNDLLEYIEAGSILGFDEKTAENGVKRLMREHNLPYIELSPNNIKFRYGDLIAYIKNKTVNTDKAYEPKTTDTNFEKTKNDVIMTENTLKIKMAELNIKALEDIQTMRDTLQNERQALLEDRVKVTTQQEVLNSLKNDLNALLTTLNTTIAHQEAVTKEANEKLSLANSKLDNYDKLQEKKCAECLRRDKNKCAKCGYKIFCDTKKSNDYKKWMKKNIS